jgi:hypothetical protein
MGVLPSDLDSWLRYVREDEGWRKRSLSELEELLAALRITLVRGAWRVYRTRCSLMAAWWSSAAASEHRASLAWDMAEKMSKRRAAASARLSARLTSQRRDVGAPVERRYPLRDRRPPTFLGRRVLGSTEAVAELAAERLDKFRRWDKSIMPWF